MILSKQTSEAGHWYTKQGDPAYTTLGKTGDERPTTLRDARKHGLVPSVTTVLKAAANEGLNRWIKSNLLVAAATLPRLEGESADDWITRVEEDARKQGSDAANLGTQIHASLERAYSGLAYNPEHMQYVTATMLEIEKIFPLENWKSEVSFAHKLGFGGKIDLSSPKIVIDFKTSAFDEDKKDVGGYDEHLMQLAAYAKGLEIEYPYCANVYVSTTVPGLVRITEYSAADIERGWEMFKNLLLYWQAKNKYSMEIIK